MATQMLKNAVSNISSDINSLEKIKYIANVRFALRFVASMIHEIFSATFDLKLIGPRKRRLLQAAANICAESKMEWPR